MFAWIWIISIIAAMYIADQKGRSVIGFFLLGLFTGPIALLIALLLSPQSRSLSKPGGPVNNLQEAQRQLQELKTSLWNQEIKIKRLEDLINQLSQGTSQAAVSSSPGAANVEQRPVSPVLLHQESPLQPKETKEFLENDMELKLGRHWLNKIGIAVLALGVAFLISYTFKYFGPYLKILFGYAVAVALFYAGFKLETKEKYASYGRGLLGGGWAIVYFTTYAMHHFAASRILASQTADLVLLALVVIGMMAHVLKYQSESMMSVALLVAYVTSTIGHITGFTVISTLMLGVLTVILFNQFNWTRTFALSLILTYGIHTVWVMPNLFASFDQTTILGFPVRQYHHLMNFIFLSGYAFVFFAGIHLAKSKDAKSEDTLAAINFCNITAYSMLSYPLILRLFHPYKFAIVLGVGIIYLLSALIMKRLGKGRLFLSDMTAAVFMMSCSFVLQYSLSKTMMIWLVEVPCLVLIGFQFKEKLYRYFAYALSLVIALDIFSMSCWMRQSNVHIFGFVWTWIEFVSFAAALSMGVCYFMTHRSSKADGFNEIDRMAGHWFSAVALVYFNSWMFSAVRDPWLPLFLIIEGIGLLVLSHRLSLKRFRAYAYLILMASALTYMGEADRISSHRLEWFFIAFQILIFFAIYFTMKHGRKLKVFEPLFELEEAFSYWISVILLIFSIHYFIAPAWISLTLGACGVALIMAGIAAEGKMERLGGLALLGLTLGRVVFVDLARVDMIFKIITFIILGVLLLAVSFIYNKFDINKK